MEKRPLQQKGAITVSPPFSFAQLARKDPHNVQKEGSHLQGG